jgi:hypothetical protein
MKASVLEALEMARKLQDKLSTLPRTCFTTLARTAMEEVIDCLTDESEAD